MNGMRPILIALAGCAAAAALAFAAPVPEAGPAPRVSIVVGPVQAVAALDLTGVSVALRWRSQPAPEAAHVA